MLDFIRIACAVPAVRVGDVVENTRAVCDFIRQADEKRADVLIFPELALTGYTCGDLFFQQTLLSCATWGLKQVVTCSREHPDITVVVGLPAVIDGQMYNCAAVVSGGRLHGLVPKTYIPNYSEFDERRWFSSGSDLQRSEICSKELGLDEGYAVPLGDVLLRICDGTVLGVEICEDLWSPLPKSTLMALNGAELIVNLSATSEAVGKRERRRELVKHQSSACKCVYAYVSAGCSESTADMVFPGHSIVAENGRILTENKDQIASGYLLVCDADLGRIRADRRRNKSVKDAVSGFGGVKPARTVDCHSAPARANGELYALRKNPFVPEDETLLKERCRAVFNIQVAGLKQRLSVIRANPVVGISGGLDSTLALLVAAEAVRQLGRPMTDVYGVTMPCFGTSDRTYRNSWELMRTLGISAKEISIANAVKLHFRDIGHDMSVHDGTYENSQARERTQVLMDYASVVGGIVVGTGDLSELALGWCTYNGDHMSMYGVNGSVPKTMIPWIIDTVSESPEFAPSRAVLKDILDTPISPELLPPDEEGKISQHTEDLVGPYALHDFFLYHVLRWGYSPTKIYTLACRAFRGEYEVPVIKKWLKAFYRRFFTQQFKRNCMPDGVKVGSVSLSPRGDWRMPSDGNGRIWLEEAETL